MEIINFVDIGVPIFGETYGVSLNWIGNLIRLLVSGVGVVGVGVILFSLVLKLVVLPFDVFQRISMRKQNNKMKEQKEKMERLQKQYANNKEMYNQKVMEMYKENGFSMCSSCLPMIISLVIFIVAINAFNAYSQYSNVQNYNTMVEAYNAELKFYCAEIKEENVSWKEGDEQILVKDENGNDKYIYFTTAYNAEYGVTAAEIAQNIGKAKKNYYINVNKIAKDADVDLADGKADTFAGQVMEYAYNVYTETQQTADPIDVSTAVQNYFIECGQNAVVDAYQNTVKGRTQFLWIKNVWSTDASYKHPVLSYSKFASEAKQEKFKVDGKKVKYGSISEKTGTDVYTESTYNVITAKLTKEKKQANGYYILIAMSIGTILLQQFVSMRSQKDQQKYASVDGQGGSQQKIMMVVMTGMFAIFSFMYSAAFSLYMITSNIFSLLSTIVINKLVDRSAAKKEARAVEAKLGNRHTARLEAAKNAGKNSAKTSQDKKSQKKK